MAEPIATAFVEVRPDISGFGTALTSGLGAQLAGLGRGGGVLGKGLGKNALLAGGAVAGVVTGVGLLGAAAASAAIDFESAFAGVRKTVNATEEEFAALKDGILEMSTEIPVAATELARIGEAAGQLGVANDSILEFTDTVAKLGVTTNLTSEEAADGFARFANILQTPQDQFSNLGSTVVDLGNKMAATESEILEFGLRIAGAGAQVGIAESEILAIGAALASVGLNAEAGGTAVSTAISTIASNVAKGGKRLDEFARVAGQSSQEFVQSFKTDAAGAFVIFVEGLRRISDEGGNVFAVLDRLGLGGIRVRDTLLRASNAGDLLRESLQTGAAAFEENTALTAEAEKRFATTASQIQILKNNVTALAIETGDLLLPAVNKLVGGLTFLVKGLGDVKDEFAKTMDAAGVPAFIDGVQDASAATDDFVSRATRSVGRTVFDEVFGDAQKFGLFSTELEKAERGVRDLFKAFRASDRGGTSLNEMALGLSKLAEELEQGGPEAQRLAERIRILLKYVQDFGRLPPVNIELFLKSDTIKPGIDRAKRDLEALPEAFLSAFGNMGPEFSKTIEDTFALIPPIAAKSGKDSGDEFLAAWNNSIKTLGAAVPLAADFPQGGDKVSGKLSSEKIAKRLLPFEAAVSREAATGTSKSLAAALRAEKAEIEKILATEKLRLADEKLLYDQLTSINSELESIAASAAAEDERAADAAAQAARDAKSAKDAKYQALLDSLSIREQQLQNKVLAAAADESLANDIWRNKKLKQFYLKAIASGKLAAAELADYRNKLLQVNAELKRLRQQRKDDAVSDREDQLQDQLTLAQISDKSTKDDERALNRLITFYRKQWQRAKKGSAERRKWLIKLRQAQEDKRQLKEGTGQTGANFNQLAFGFLQSQQGFFANVASNIFPTGSLAGSVTTDRGSAATGLGDVSIPFRGAGAQSAVDSAATLEAAGKEREKGMTRAQASTLIHLSRQTLKALSDLHRGAGHPELRKATARGGAGMDTQ